MINSVELGNFLSHSNTKLSFEDGVTVFVGNNGAGKSSIIDGITFALFGKHTRKSSKGLIRRGFTQGYAKVEFTIKGQKYEAVRKIDSKGGLASKFSKVNNGEVIEIASGERKQFGESMTQEIEKTLGLNFEKLKIASIVQQGELNAIIKAKPKEFKELLNAVIGIDKLDIASNNIKEVIKEFREKIKEKEGYDDTHIDILERDLENYRNDVQEAKPQKVNLQMMQKNLQIEVSNLRRKLEEESPKIEKIKQLELRKSELRSYAQEAIKEIQREIAEKERKIEACKHCFEYAGVKNDLENKLQKITLAIDESQKKIRDLSNLETALKEKQNLAKKLQLKDNKCPVCDSEVEKLNPLFQEKHLIKELDSIKEKIFSSEKEKTMYQTKKTEFSQKLQNAINAEATLKAHSIKDEKDLNKIRDEVNEQKTNVNKIPLISSGNLLEFAKIDSHSKLLFDTITKLEEETKGFEEKDFVNLKKVVEEKQYELSNIDQKLGAITEKIFKCEEKISRINESMDELRKVKEYMKELKEIQTNIFNRDGLVATSLRSWALNSISSKASEYLILLNTKIQRIYLSEKARDISITCYARKEVLDLESLSGGEQVSVALALRLGMANLLGASNLNLMILDEPTTHLDAERKKSLVGVLSQLSNITNSASPLQFLIITHDAEIFEDSTVEKIFRFESTEMGSKIISM